MTKTIPLNGPALGILANAERIEGNPHVIAGAREGEYPKDFQKPWRQVREVAALDDVRIHDFGPTFVSEAVMAGESLPTVGKVLGHPFRLAGVGLGMAG